MTCETLDTHPHLSPERLLRLECLVIARALRLLDAHRRGEQLQGNLLDGADTPGDDILIGEAAAYSRSRVSGTRQFIGHEDPIYIAGHIRGLDVEAIDAMPWTYWNAYSIVRKATHDWATPDRLDVLPDPGPLDQGPSYTLREVTLEEMKERVSPAVRDQAEERAQEIRAQIDKTRGTHPR